MPSIAVGPLASLIIVFALLFFVTFFLHFLVGFLIERFDGRETTSTININYLFHADRGGGHPCRTKTCIWFIYTCAVGYATAVCANYYFNWDAYPYESATTIDCTPCGDDV